MRKTQVWRLMVWNVISADNVTLVKMLGFRPCSRTPEHWWHLYNPNHAPAKERATKHVKLLKEAGLKFSWSQVDRPAREELLVGPVSYVRRRIEHAAEIPDAPPPPIHPDAPHQVVVDNPHQEDGKLPLLKNEWRWVIAGRVGVINAKCLREAQEIFVFLREEYGRHSKIRPRFEVVTGQKTNRKVNARLKAARK